MSSVEGSLEKVEVGDKPHSGESLHGTMSCVNEDDEKLQTSITKKEDQRNVMIIGGVEIFLPSGRGEANTKFVEVTEGQLAETVMEET